MPDGLTIGVGDALDGRGGFVGLGEASGVARGVCVSAARLAFAFALRLSFSFTTAFTLSAGAGETATLALALAFDGIVPPAGIPSSPLPVAGEATWTGWPFGSAESEEAWPC